MLFDRARLFIQTMGQKREGDWSDFHILLVTTLLLSTPQELESNETLVLKV